MRAHGQGSVRRWPNGKWQGRIRLPNGKEYAITCATKREAERAIHKARLDAEAGMAPPDPTMTVNAWLDRWLETVVKPTREPRTYEGYAGYCAGHIRPALGKKKLAQLTVDDVQRMLNGMQGAGLSPRTLQYCRAVLRRALNVAIKQGVLQRNVAALAEVPTVRPYEAKALTAEEARAILAAVKGTNLEVLVLVALALGLRMGEVLGLTWGRVDLERGFVRIEQTLSNKRELRQTKTPKSNRAIPVPNPVIDALRTHLSQKYKDFTPIGVKHELVFTTAKGAPLNGPYVTKRFQTLLRRANLPVIRFHDLRHGSASFLMSLGVPLPVAMAILGHSQASTLYNIYAHATEGEMRSAMEKLGALLGG